MAANGKAENRIRIDQLCIGLHVKLDSWMGHPFLFSSFRIKNEKQIAALRSMGLTDIEYVPEKSKASPPPISATPATSTPPTADETSALDELMREKKARIETLHRERERIRAAERKYVKTAGAIKNVMRLANSNPRQAVELSGEVAGELAEVFLSEQNPFIHLMGDNVADENAYFHSVNVTVLSLILARALGITDAETMRDIAQGAVLHDVGKSMLPTQMLLKEESLTAPELKLYRMHPAYGLKLMQPPVTLTDRVRGMILFHHELCDGSGYPKGLNAGTLDQSVRIVTIANAYDNLCNPRNVKHARTPAEALSFMYKNEAAKYDRSALPAFIKSLGIYPPGTIVKLESGRIGIVMSVDSTDLLHPNLMLFDPTIPKDDAAAVNLKHDLDDRIERTLRPAALPQAVHDYLSPRKHICYFVDHAGKS
jgi:HD-GYP domain-containing protein (c-di-GMP phosphodiesterase class II)